MVSLAQGTFRINFESLNIEWNSFTQSDYKLSQPCGGKKKKSLRAGYESKSRRLAVGTWLVKEGFS